MDDSGGERQAGNDGVGDVGDGDGGRDDEADGEEKNRAQIQTEIPPRGVDGLDVEERRQEDEEDKIGIELELRQEESGCS